MPVDEDVSLLSVTDGNNDDIDDDDDETPKKTQPKGKGRATKSTAKGKGKSKGKSKEIIEVVESDKDEDMPIEEPESSKAAGKRKRGNKRSAAALSPPKTKIKRRRHNTITQATVDTATEQSTAHSTLPTTESEMPSASDNPDAIQVDNPPPPPPVPADILATSDNVANLTLDETDPYEDDDAAMAIVQGNKPDDNAPADAPRPPSSPLTPLSGSESQLPPKSAYSIPHRQPSAGPSTEIQQFRSGTHGGSLNLNKTGSRKVKKTVKPTSGSKRK